jgi:hypothetical protein
MPTEVIAANPRVAENTGQVAVQRGPVVFCLEESDQPGGTALADVSMGRGANFKTEYKADLLDGVEVLQHEGEVAETPSGDKALYLPATAGLGKARSAELTLIPYYAWANRKPSAMQVWVPYTRS